MQEPLASQKYQDTFLWMEELCLNPNLPTGWPQTPQYGGSGRLQREQQTASSNLWKKCGYRGSNIPELGKQVTLNLPQEAAIPLCLLHGELADFSWRNYSTIELGEQKEHRDYAAYSPEQKLYTLNE